MREKQEHNKIRIEIDNIITIEEKVCKLTVRYTVYCWFYGRHSFLIWDVRVQGFNYVYIQIPCI